MSETPPSGLTVTASVPARLTFDYRPSAPRMVSLYEQAKQAQWNATTDVDWSVDVAFGSPLPADSSYVAAAFATSPLARRGLRMRDTFRWEFQSWMVSQFLHGEQGALVSTARLVETLPDLVAKYYAASQVGDEARHVEVFSRYLRDKVPHPYPISSPLAALLADILDDSRWDVVALGMQIMVEPLAMAAFRLANSTFHDDLIKQITHLVARDEARHVSFGILLLGDVYGDMRTAERAEREEFVLEAAHLLSRRFLLEDVWERLEVDREEGMAWAATNELMVGYRRTVFAKVVSALERIHLLTARVRDGLTRLGLLTSGGHPAVAAAE